MSRSRVWRVAVVALAGLVALGAARLLDPPPLTELRNAWFDAQQQLLPRAATGSLVTVVDIDEASIARLGQWPWPRDMLAELVSALASHGPLVIGLGIIFSEPDRTSPENLAARTAVDPRLREALAALPSHDARLAEALRGAPTVLAIGAGAAPAASAPSRPQLTLRVGPGADAGLRRYGAALENLELLQRASAGSGVASLSLDRDGVVRRLPLAMIVGDAVMPGFALEMLRVAMGADAIALARTALGDLGVAVGTRMLAADSAGDVWVRYSAPGSFARMSAAEVLAGRADAPALRDRVVLIGASGIGLGVTLVSPGGAALGNLDAQAQFVENLFADSYLLRPELAPYVELAAAMLACLLVLVLRPGLRGYAGQTAVLGLLAALFAASLYAVAQHRLLLDPTFAALAALAVYLGLIGAGIVQAQRERRHSEQRFRDYAETASDWFWETGAEHQFTYFSEQVGAFGLDRDALIGKRCTAGAADLEAEPEKWRLHLAARERHEPFRNFEYKCLDAKGHPRQVSMSGRPVFNAAGRFAGYRGTGADLTERREMEERLHQAQKMDTIGQLTGGVAHDFNNLLTVIIGNADMLADDPGMAAGQRRLAESIRDTGQRAAALTSRLLAFARRQALQPRKVDANALLAGMEPLLRRSLGETVALEWVRGSGLWQTSIDPGQLENAILNLAINARDAMPLGGTLTVETGNADLDGARAGAPGDARPGQYVMVAVADTGKGMAPEVVARAFEPFFTTKGVGKGTGLGLSMVYGFVRQSGGHVTIDSEVGGGTTVRLYLPRAAGNEPQPAVAPETRTEPTGVESILLVEDEGPVRDYVAAQLTRLGYTVVAVANGPSALEKLRGRERVDMLFTDVVMPGGINGRQLAEAAERLRPGIKVLFTSGYSEDVVVHHGRLDPGVQLLNKPYRAVDLARKVRAVLDGG